MPYKIFTYEDPYKLDKADFWDEISALPHFCGARTLVNGLKDVLGNGIKGLICPLDTLIEHQDVYRNWTNSIGLRIQQYSALTSSFKHLLETEQIDEIFHMALTQNQNHFLDAIRLFIELDISAAAIDHKKGNHEQRLFVYILNKAQNSDLFRFPATPSREKLKEIMVDIAEKEVKDCRGPQREAARCSRTLELTRQSPLNAVVVHGVHQFSPVQLRLLIAMEKMGLTIIFLFNYQKKYSKVYSSWNDIYGCFSVPIHHDTAVKEYQMPTMQNPSNALACAIGELCEGRYSLGNPKFRQWYQLYSGIELVEFTNITEYAHFVSNHFETAIRKYDESRSIMDRGNNVWDKEAVLRYLDEQVYTANRDVHTLLKIYYPDYAKDRHFLSYPIGQFFSAIYRLWDYDKGEIIIDSAAIKECLSSNVLRAAPGEVLLRTFCNVDILFERISTFGDFRREIASAYAANYDRVIAAKSTDAIFPLKQLSIYNKYKVAKKDILALIRAIEEINEIAAYLFALDNSRQDFINFRTHFKKLEEFLKQRDLSSASEQERLLIKALQLRLNRVKPEQSSFSGTFGDLKEGLHYYLKQDHVNFVLDEDPDMIKGRLMAALNFIDQETDVIDSSNCKIVVFTAHNATLMSFLRLFNSRYSEMGVQAVPFGTHMSRAELEESVYRFQNDPDCRVIVCDETGGEGRNFQNAEMVIHLDMPWNANALEQRIGRLDRLGRDPDMDVLSVVLYAEDSVEEQLFHIWRDGMKLFEQSLSGLEIITGELNNLIVEALLEDYYTGLTNAFDDILEQAAEMRESVEDEQDFDLGVTLYRPLSQGINHLLSMYDAEDNDLFATAMMGWAGQAGLFAEKPSSDGLIEFRESTFSVNAARQSLFIPPDWEMYRNSPIMRRKGKILGSFDRKTASMREDILFFAPGDALYDAIISNAIGCSRGRCSAIAAAGGYNYDGIVYIYNIEPQVDELLEMGAGLQTLSQYRMYLPLEQIMIPMPLTASSRNVPEKEVLNALLSITWRNAEHLGRRSSGRMTASPLERFIENTPPNQWEPLIDKCSATAYQKAVAVMREISDLSSAKKEMQRVLNGYRAECIYFERDNSIIAENTKTFQATLKALTSAKPILDAVCFFRVRKNG